MTALLNAAAVRSDIRFEKRVPTLGCFALRPLRAAEDAPLIHDWVTRDYARFWNMGRKSLVEVEAFYETLMVSGDATAWIGLFNGVPAFLVELYDPAGDPVGDHYPVRTGDRGMHFLVGPPTERLSGFTYAVLLTIMDFIFVDPAARRVVVEPDVRNEKIHALNRRVGFLYDREIELGEKTAHLAFCTREQFMATLIGRTGR
jgi:Acetyltransferases, including N-acetylases of ribosomal proteins